MVSQANSLTWRDDSWGDDYRPFDEPRTEPEYNRMAPLEALQSYTRFHGAQFREHQLDAIKFIRDSSHKVIVLESPTGSGKSIIGAVAGKVLGSLTYMCHSKILQEQLAQDFPDFKILMGRNNYPCGRAMFLKADECHFSKCYSSCPYTVQKKAVLAAQLKVINYSYFLAEANGPGKFSGIDFAVCDEADTLESILSGYISLEFNERTIDDLALEAPRYRTTSSEHSVPEWQAWALTAMSAVLEKIGELENELKLRGFYDENTKPVRQEEDEFGDTPNETLKKMAKKVKYYKNLEKKLVMFHTHVDKSWLYKEESTRYGLKWIFEPLWVNEDMTQQYFLKHIQRKVVLMSATFPPMNVLSQILGIPMKLMDYMRIPSTFDPARRPVYLQACGSLNQKTFDADVEKVVAGIDRIIEKYPDEKGLIHCVSYKLMTAILDKSVHKSRMIDHNSSNRLERLEQFKSSMDPLIFLSPSMERGVSLNDDLARFIIIAKAPFEYLGDKRVSQRLYSGRIGQEWYTAMTIQNIIQMCGRGMRHADDHCDVYIVDQAAKDVILRNVKLFPEYFREAMEIV